LGTFLLGPRSSGAPRDESVIDIAMVDFRFEPFEAIVPEGFTVRWTNLDFDEHDTFSEAGGWRSALLGHLETFDFVTEVGNQTTYEYECTIHGGMNGRLIIVEAPEPVGAALLLPGLIVVSGRRRRVRLS
jgi:plastocyanin